MSAAPSYQLRPATDADDELLYRIYAAGRAEELAPVPWTPQQKADFLRMQHRAQHSYYHQQWPNARYDLVMVDGQPAGRLYVETRAEEVRVMDISILPEHRRRGLATALLQAVFAEASGLELPVRIHVERFNPAQALYRKLGFQQIGGDDVYLLMERKAS